ncbi:hypothetical protein [Sinorhizobium meliloti]|uniref:COG3904 family protein n=1 Tax=Rhizobium meliloti TaxID=382 RepID=UPI00129744E1|nr:hypothetical protein [Sinorhizobium meliloti]MQX01383.1 hypothetical protein [Sinorhizobium meliloti]
MMKGIVARLLAATVAVSATSAAAVEISMERGNATSKIIVTGSIERGDAQRFKDYWDENAYDSFRFIVSLDSPGGSLVDGIEIGQFIRKNGAHTEVRRYSGEIPGRYREELSSAECYSACALAFMGGVEREVADDGKIGFHQFYGGSSSSGDCQEFCAVGHDDEKERIITWLSRKNFWTSSWLDVIHPRFSARTVCWTI